MKKRFSKRKEEEKTVSSGLCLGFLISGILLLLTGYGVTVNPSNFYLFYLIPIPWWAWLSILYFTLSYISYKIASNKRVTAEDIVGPFI